MTRPRLGLTVAAVLAAAGGLSAPVALAQPDAPGAFAPPPPETDTTPAPPPARRPPPDAASDEAAASDQPPPPKPVVPPKRQKRTAAILQALDKVTAETLRFEADINQPVRYKDLVFTVHDCEDTASDEPEPGAIANLEIDSQPKPPPGQPAPPARQLFKGWMFSNAPGAHPFEHPVYDAWLIACKTATPGS